MHFQHSLPERVLMGDGTTNTIQRQVLRAVATAKEGLQGDKKRLIERMTVNDRLIED